MRQYIGARYVPTYYKNSLDPTSSEWEANVQYDPLTIVSLPNLHSYQSKKFVPANIGSPASNPEFWYDQGYANAYFQSLQDQINDMKDGTVSGSLQDQINNNTSDITALSNKVNRKWVFFGDSYGTNYNSGGVDIVGWFDKVKPLMSIANDDIAHSYVASGIGFIGANNDSTTAWKTMLNTYAQDNTVTDVCFIGGDNDVARNMSDLATAINQTLTMAKSKYPNARIWIGFCAIDFTEDQTHNVQGAYSVYAKYGEINGAIIMSGTAYCLYDTSYLLNQSHPNNNGTDILAGAIASALRGGTSYNGKQNTAVTIDYSDPNVLSGVQFDGMVYNIDGDHMTLSFLGASGHTERCVLKFTTAANGNGDLGSPITFGKITNMPLGKQGVQSLGAVPCAIEYTNEGWRNCSVLFQIWNNYLQCRILDVKQSTGFVYDMVKQIQIPATKFYIDLLRYARYQY